MKWFTHDSNARSDVKLRKVLMRYGADGYGLYWYCLELIAGKVDASNVTFELEHDAEILAHDLKIDSLRVEEIMRYMISLNLFEVSDGAIRCMKMAKRLDERFTRSPELKAAIRAAKGLVSSEDSLKTLPDLSEDSLKSVAAIRQDKRRHKNNGDEYTADFALFWSEWPEGHGTKGPKSEAFKEWRKIKGMPPVGDVIAAAKAQAAYKDARKAAGQFAENFKHVCRWIRGKEWENDAPAYVASSGEVYR